MVAQKYLYCNISIILHVMVDYTYFCVNMITKFVSLGYLKKIATANNDNFV